jgi:hypothetical protein
MPVRLGRRVRGVGDATTTTEDGGVATIQQSKHLLSKGAAVTREI